MFLQSCRAIRSPSASPTHWDSYTIRCSSPNAFPETEIAQAARVCELDRRARAFGSGLWKLCRTEPESPENILSEDAFDALVETRKKRLVQTMRSRLVRDLARHLNEPSLRGLSLRAMKSESESSSATVAVSWRRW